MKYPLIAAVFVIDQATKFFAVRHLAGAPDAVLIPGCLGLRYATNLGAAFSMFQGQGAVLSLFTVGAMAWIAWWARSVPREQGWLLYGLSLIFGGAAGNLADRLFRGDGFMRGHVVDFIDAYWRNHHWPTFNVADSAICVGVGCVMLAFFLYPPDTTEDPETATTEGEHNG